MRNFLIVLGFAVLAGTVFSAATAGTIFFFRRRMDAASWIISATAGSWAVAVCVIVLSQGLVSPETANVLVPVLLIVVSIAALWNSVHFLRRIW
jgi:Na+/melibiose symporter-like transporter